MAESRTKRWVTLGLMLGMFVAALDQTVVDTAFPKMIADLGGVDIFSWVITIYLLASTSIVPVVGKLADIFGRRIFYMLGLLLFVGGSMLCGAAQSMTQLIIFRGLQGAGGGMLMPIALTVIGDLFPGAERARMQGLFAGVFGLSSILGPKLGGWLTHHYSWRMVFYINLPIGILAAIIMLLFYRETRGERRPVDYVGSITVTTGITLLLLALARGGDPWPWASWQIISLFAGAALSLALFVWTETRVPEPILDLSLFRNRTFTVMSLVGLIMGAGMFGAMVYVPWFIQGVVGVNPDVAGNVMTPTMLTMVVFAFLSGRLALKVPYRVSISLGFLFVMAGYYLMTGWGVDTTQVYATLCTMVVGAGLGLIMPTLTFSVQNAFPANKRGVVTSAATFFRQVGSTVGVTVFNLIFNGQIAKYFAADLKPMLMQAAPMISQMPAEAQARFQQMLEKPAMLVQLLLREELHAQIPEMMWQPLKAAIRLMLADSLHVVFWTAIGAVAIGLVTAQFLGWITLKSQTAGMGGEAHLEAPLIAD